MKKMITLLLAAVMVLTCMTGVVFAAEAGESVTISFTLAENPGFAAFGAQINYDAEALELVEIKQGAILSGAFMGNPANGKIGFAAMGTNITATGVVFTATFQIKEGAELGTYPVTVTMDPASTVDASSNPVTLSIAGGEIEVTCEHDWDDWDVDTEPTCTEDGLKVRECSKCGETEEDVIPATGHAWGEWDVETEPTCTEDGLKVRECSNCGETEEDEIPATGHNHSDEWAYDDDNHWHECDCGDIADQAAHTIDWVVVKNNTHNEDGLKEKKCTVCAYTTGETEVIPADPNLDPVPGTGDMTMTFVLGFVAVVAMGGAALFVFKRKLA